MTDQQLKFFILLAEKKSLGKAESALFISKQALKKQIDSLESEVGFALFSRSHKGLALTPAGEEFYWGARKLLAEMEDLRQRGKKLALNEQTIRIKVPQHPRLVLEKAFIEFARLYPNVRQQMILQSRNNFADDVHFAEDILDRRADIAECIFRPDLLRRGIACTKLLRMPYKCLISPTHPLSSQKSVRIGDLAGNHVGLLERNTKLAERITTACRGVSLETFPNNNIQSIYNLCYNNGVFISKAYYVGTMQPLVAIPLETDIVPVAAVIYHEKPSPLVREFLKVARDLYPYEDEDRASTGELP